MSQTWNLPLAATQLLSDARTELNFAFGSLKSHFIGTSDPTGVFEDGMIWANTTPVAKLKHRAGGATVVIGDWGVNNLGHIRADGAIPFSGDQSMGSNKITNLTISTSPLVDTEAATIGEVKKRIAKTGGADGIMTGRLSLTSDGISPLDGENEEHAVNVRQLNGRLSTAGGTITGEAPGDIRYQNPGISARNANDDDPGTGMDVTALLSKEQIRLFTSFSTSLGHDHNGINSRGVVLTAGRAASEPTRKFLESDGAAPSNARWTTVPSTVCVDPPVELFRVDGVPENGDSGWITRDISANVQKNSAGTVLSTFVWVRVVLHKPPDNNFKLFVRRTDSGTLVAAAHGYLFLGENNSIVSDEVKASYHIIEEGIIASNDVDAMSKSAMIQIPISPLGKFDYTTNATSGGSLVDLAMWLVSYG